MISYRAAGLIYGPESHYLDHLAPLCSLLHIPLCVTEESIFILAKEFYPGLDVRLENYPSMGSYLIEHFDILFHCSVRQLFDNAFFFVQKLHNKKIHTIWCPHGNSDKGHSSYFMEALKEESVALIYGQKMLELLDDKGVLEKLKSYATIGNYRLCHYLKNKPFYQNLVRYKIARRLPSAKKKILYAPTWNDTEKSTSFYDASLHIINNLPEEYDLIIKIHPNLPNEDPVGVERILARSEENDSILLLENFPTIYPLLEYVDIYIGDASSIGYDFLPFNKPMLLLNQNNRDSQNDQGLYLYQSGIEVRFDQYPDIYKILSAYLPSDLSHFTDIRKKIEKFTFGDKTTEESIQQKIEALYRTFPEPYLNFY
ncbi:MAG: CDP-glycerol glycerophosphotransferase family protein [Chlamydiae bacterium]|nr:CDP-glycerol glycerophosphotransferase family protein [Chlamydiota bacterium]